MKKIVIATLAGIAALGVSACSEKAQDAAANTADAVGDDMGNAASDVGNAVEGGVDAVGNAAEATGDAAANGAAAVEADAQDESTTEAKKD